jgi:serine/threonine protein kinase
MMLIVLRMLCFQSCIPNAVLPYPLPHVKINGSSPVLNLLVVVQVIMNIATLLQEMHTAGYAHLDVKPVNVVWISHVNQWKLIDLGSAALLGQHIPLRFTLAYAAPEIITAWKSGDKAMESTTATDAWALGVMMYEMLTCKPAFDMSVQSHDSVRFLLSWCKQHLKIQGRLCLNRIDILNASYTQINSALADFISASG